MFANDGFKIRGWDETGLHVEIYEIHGSLWHNQGETLSNIKDGPYRLTSWAISTVGHIDPGPYRLAFSLY